MSGVRAVSAGSGYSLFLKTDGTVLAAGSGGGQLGIGDWGDRLAPAAVAVTFVKAIAAGAYHSLFLKTDSTVVAAGGNSDGQLGLSSLGVGTFAPPSNVPLPVMFIGTGTSPWLHGYFGEEAANARIAGWDADPDQDGVSNLLEYAFNLSPVRADSTPLSPSTGTAGLPWVTMARRPEGPVLTVHYLRFKGATLPKLVYTPEFSSLEDGGEGEGWSTLAGSETVEPLGGGWERVTLEDLTGTGNSVRFVRVRVTPNEFLIP
jgi:hypothetical protein